MTDIVTKPTLDDMQAARERISDVVVHTPLVPLHSYNEPAGIHLKLEIHQPITSFKIRGIYNAVLSLSPAERARGIGTTSAGNTAQAVAWCGQHFGIPAQSLMPDYAPQTKIDAVRAYGGTPVLVPSDEVFRFMRERGWEQEDYAYIHPWINRDVMLGHASAGLEILEDLPEVETVFIPVGGGGFISGVASAFKTLKPTVRIVAVEPEDCPAISASLAQGSPASVDCQTICDGVAVPYMTDELFPLLQEIIDDVMLISEQRVKEMIRELALGNRIIAEGAGALAVAAAVDTPPDQRGPSVAIVTGGSIDTRKLIDILSQNAGLR